MKRVLLLICAVILLLSFPVSAAADNAAVSAGKHLNIVTTDNGPLSIDRLLYIALNNINCDVTFTCPVVSEGFTSANGGTRDGVIAAFPNLDEIYPNLRKVPVILEQINVLVFAREGSYISINSWSELDGLSVGILINRTYILDRLPENVTITTKDTSKSVLDGLIRGEYDVAVLIERTHETISERSGITVAGQVDQLTEYLYLNKAHEALIPSLTEALNNVFDSGLADKILRDIPIPEINQKKTVVRIISSNPELTREDQFNAALEERFKNDMTIEWYNVSLNSSRFSKDPNRLSYFASLLRQDCVSRNVAAVIVSGDVALEFLFNYYYLYFRNVPVLFYGVSDQHKNIIQDYENYFSGIEENLEAYETACAALSLFPDTKNIYVVNDYSAQGARYRSIIETQLKPLEDNVNISYNENMSCESLLTFINGLPEDSIVMVGSYFSDADGQYYVLNEMQRLLDRDCDVPVFSLYSTNVEYNAVGGKGPDYSKYGEAIAVMLQYLLEGASISDLPSVAELSVQNRWVFDKIMLKRFGIDEKDLPAGSQVINKVPSIWESDPRFAVTLSILLIVIMGVVIGISVLFIQRNERKKQRINDAKIREVKERLERIINTAPISYMLTIDGQVVEINETMQKNTGLNVGETVYPLTFY